MKSKTEATPLYTNYKDSWPLTAWTNVLGSVTCDPQAKNKLATEDPWAPGKDLTVGDSLLFNAVKNKLTEADPTTTNWEESKGRFAKGEIATMWLGSWAIPQMQDAAKKANIDPAAVGFMPFPAQVNGKFCAALAPDYRYAINTHSEHKEAARAWLDWMVDKSGFAALNQGVPGHRRPGPVRAEALPGRGRPAPRPGPGGRRPGQRHRQGRRGRPGRPDYRKHLVDVARGA